MKHLLGTCQDIDLLCTSRTCSCEHMQHSFICAQCQARSHYKIVISATAACFVRGSYYQMTRIADGHHFLYSEVFDTASSECSSSRFANPDMSETSFLHPHSKNDIPSYHIVAHCSFDVPSHVRTTFLPPPTSPQRFGRGSLENRRCEARGCGHVL